MRTPARRGLLATSALGVLGSMALLVAQSPQPPAHTALFYTRDGLRLESYLYLPAQPGPAPLVIYNHGSRVGVEKTERPFPWIARFLTTAGYAVLVPERRGYGQSEGPTFTEQIGDDRGPRFIARLQAETDDALAAVDDALATAGTKIDRGRMVIMGEIGRAIPSDINKLLVGPMDERPTGRGSLRISCPRGGSPPGRWGWR